MCVYTYIHVCIYVNKYLCTTVTAGNTHTRRAQRALCVYAHMHIRIYLYIHVHIYVYIITTATAETVHARTKDTRLVHMYLLCECMYMCIYVYIFIHAYKYHHDCQNRAHVKGARFVDICVAVRTAPKCWCPMQRRCPPHPRQACAPSRTQQRV